MGTDSTTSSTTSTADGALEALVGLRRRRKRCRTGGRVDTVDGRRRPGGGTPIGPPMAADSARRGVESHGGEGLANAQSTRGEVGERD